MICTQQLKISVDTHRSIHSIGHVTLVAFTVTTILVPYLNWCLPSEKKPFKLINHSQTDKYIISVLWTKCGIDQSPQHTCPISHTAPFRTGMSTFLFWMVYCEIWDLQDQSIGPDDTRFSTDFKQDFKAVFQNEIYYISFATLVESEYPAVHNYFNILAFSSRFASACKKYFLL